MKFIKLLFGCLWISCSAFANSNIINKPVEHQTILGGDTVYLSDAIDHFYAIQSNYTYTVYTNLLNKYNIQSNYINMVYTDLSNKYKAQSNYINAVYIDLINKNNIQSNYTYAVYTNLLDKIANIKPGGECSCVVKKYPMFILNLNDVGLNSNEQTVTTGFSMFELKASTNNFNTSNQVIVDSKASWSNHMVYWAISETNSTPYTYADTTRRPSNAESMLKFVNDSFSGYVTTTNGQYDTRSKRKFISINECTNKYPKYVIVVLDIDEIDKVEPIDWLNPNNDNLVWSYLRCTIEGDMEKDTDDNLIWHPIEPVKWLETLPEWADGDDVFILDILNNELLPPDNNVVTNKVPDIVIPDDNNVVTNKVPDIVIPDDNITEILAITNPLCFTAEESNAKLQFRYGNYNSDTSIYQQSRDNKNWVNYITNSEIILTNINDKIYFRRTPNTDGNTSLNFIINSGKIAASGNIESLRSVTTIYDTAEMYTNLFENCTALTQAPELPATNLVANCYYRMFAGCSSLEQAPELPATALNQGCYKYMFQKCTSLTQAPELPATNLFEKCYCGMFEGCSSLEQASELPATTLANYCYQSMFAGCSSLEQAPELPAMTLRGHCYNSMFFKCTSLKTMPNLLATTLNGYCYYKMFEGCTNLTYVTKLPAVTTFEYCYASMFTGCSSITNTNEILITLNNDDDINDITGMFSFCTQLTEAQFLNTSINVISNSSAFIGVQNVNVKCSDGNITITN